MKKANKDKNKSKRVHFDETQIKDTKIKRALSVEKQQINEHKNMFSSSNTINSSRMSTASTQKKTSIEDFDIMKELGHGAYAKVILAKHTINGKFYAIKKMNKNMLNNCDKQHEVHIEKQILAELRHPNIVKLNKTFQDKKHLYFVLEYCRNKDLSKLINNLGKLDYKLAQFYAAELLSAISYMHKKGVYHRDLKPENIGLDEDMHLKLFDFATAIKTNKYFDLKKMQFVDINDDDMLYIMEENENCKAKDNIIKIDNMQILLLSHLFVGTPEYVSPEVLEHNYPLIGPSVDIWAFGVMLYLFFTGTTPFKAKKESEILDNIKNVKYTLDNNENIIPDDAKDLISKIFVKDPKKRIGYKSKDYSEIKTHPFFNGIDFENLEFEDPPVSDIKEKLEKFGYFFPKKQNTIINKLSEEKKEFDNDDENNEITRQLSGDNFDELKNNLKGETIEHNVINDEQSEDPKDEDDTIILEAKLHKKSPWLHYNKRLVRFYSKGHMDYFDPKTNELKGSFIINSNCKVNAIDEYRFEIETINRKYIFKHKNKKLANEWADKINYFVEQCIEKSKNK